MEREFLEPSYVTARDLPEAWFLCLREVLTKGYEYKIDRGSFAGQRRKELDFVTVNIQNPGIRPLVPPTPPGIYTTTSDDAIEVYCQRYLLSDEKQPNEQYTYGEFISAQIHQVIEMFKNQGFNTNQACMNIGNGKGDDVAINLEDPPCLRVIQIRVRYGKVHFFVYFRSWDLYAGFPVNLGGLQLMKEWVASELGVQDGSLIAASGGLHLYEHQWEYAKICAKLD